MCFGELGQTFVVAWGAAGVHAPADRALDFPAAGQHEEALDPFGPGDDAQREPETVAGPVHEVAGVAAVGPDLGDLRLGEAQPPEHVEGGVAVLDAGPRPAPERPGPRHTPEGPVCGAGALHSPQLVQVALAHAEPHVRLVVPEGIPDDECGGDEHAVGQVGASCPLDQVLHTVAAGVGPLDRRDVVAQPQGCLYDEVLIAPQVFALDSEFGRRCLVSRRGELKTPMPKLPSISRSSITSARVGQLSWRRRAFKYVVSVAAWTARIHLRTRRGDYRDQVELPAMIGNDVSGVVVETGPGAGDFQPGDEAWYLAPIFAGLGTYAEFHVVDQALVARKAAGLSHVEAAGLVLVGVTVWEALVERAGVRAGERVLVHGGAGGVGSVAIQLASALGAEVVTTARARDHEFVAGLGADIAIDFLAGDYVPQVRALGGIDVVLDTAGGDTLARSPEVLADRGRVVSIVDIP